MKRWMFALMALAMVLAAYLWLYPPTRPAFCAGMLLALALVFAHDTLFPDR